jgi:hypothetical protein
VPRRGGPVRDRDRGADGGRTVSRVRPLLGVFVAVAVVLGTTATAGAVGDGGASSHVSRDGRIITSIILGRTVPAGRGGPGSSTYWLTLTDAEIGFLLDILAAHPELADAPVFVALQPLLADGASGTVDLQVLVAGGRATTQVRAVPAPPGDARAMARRMVTELPPLVPTISPPGDVAVPVREPVFVSFTGAEWSRRVDRSLTAGAVTARVRARPVAFTVSSGDPSEAGRQRRCDGPGRPFAADDTASPSAQARRPGTCALSYSTATGVQGRRDRWYGDVTVVWRAEWTTDGVTWRSLGDIPRITVLPRRVRALATDIESGP